MRKLLFAILSAALVLRLMVFFAVYDKPHIITSHDAKQYLALAKNLVDHGVFSRDRNPPFSPEAKRTPGYPLFIAPFYKCFGGNHLPWLILSQVLMGGITVYAVFALGRLLFNPQTGLAAAAFFALSPISVMMTGKAYSETLFVLCFTVCLILLFSGLRTQKYLPKTAGALLLSVMVLIRPIALVLLPLFFLVFLFSGPLRQSWKNALVLLTLSLVLPLSWMARNEGVFGRFALSSVSGGNLLNYNVAGTEARRQGISSEQARQLLNDRLAAFDYVPADTWPVSKKEALAVEIIKERPISFFFWNGVESLNCARPGFSFLLYVFDHIDKVDSPVGVFRRGSPRKILAAMKGQDCMIFFLELFMLFYIAILLPACLWGAVFLARQRKWQLLAVLFLIPLGMMYVAGSAGNARFRLGVLPLLSVLAAAGITDVSVRIRPFLKRKSP